jgi:hypothetical protein
MKALTCSAVALVLTAVTTAPQAQAQPSVTLSGSADTVTLGATQAAWRGRHGWHGGWHPGWRRGWHRGWHRYGWGYGYPYYYRRHHYWGGAAAAGIIGLAAGAIAGSALAAQSRASSSVAYCERRFRSYDPRSGTYLGYDGLRHPCP